MKASPLQLKQYWLSSLSVSTNPQFDPSGEAQLKIESNAQRTPNAHDPKEWKVDLRVQSKVEDPKSFPYNFSLEITGVFGFATDVPAESREKIIAANGPALLYGALREILVSVTSRGPFSPVILPTVTFIDEVPQQQRPAGQKKELKPVETI